MASKSKTHYVCNECGSQSQKWQGRCPACGSWNTFVEERVQESGKDSRQKTITSKEYPKAVLLSDINSEGYARQATGSDETDRVLGGGLVAGSLTLLAGDPGIGKSTLLMQIASSLGRREKVLYVSGEESVRQLKLRAERLELPMENIYILSENNMEDILHGVEQLDPRFIIVDSIQTVYMEDMTGTPGSVGQVREATLALMKVAKGEGRSIFIVGHVTKSGNIAGPKVLEHMVDTVLYLEGEKDHPFRIIRSAKNRFGSTQEIGVFEMTELGMKGVENPSRYFLTHMQEEVPGSLVVPVLEGSRVLLVELQTLATDTNFPVPRRLSAGLDLNRTLLLTAVLEKQMKIFLGKKDIYYNIVGGLRVDDRAMDLGILLALLSSLYDIPVNKNLLVLGEVGLTGEIRAVSQLENRIRECEKLGFRQMIIPRTKDLQKGNWKMELLEAGNLREAAEIFMKRNKGGRDAQ